MSLAGTAGSDETASVPQKRTAPICKLSQRTRSEPDSHEAKYSCSGALLAIMSCLKQISPPLTNCDSANEMERIQGLDYCGHVEPPQFLDRARMLRSTRSESHASLHVGDDTGGATDGQDQTTHDCGDQRN